MRLSDAAPEVLEQFVTRERLEGRIEAVCPACAEWRPAFCIVEDGGGWKCDADLSRARREAEAAARASDLALLKAAKWESIKVERARRLLVAPTPLGTFDSDETGRSNINGQVTAILALGADAPAEITWKMHDNSFATFTPAQFVQAGLLVSEHIAAVYATSWALEQAIAETESAAELETIAWPA